MTKENNYLNISDKFNGVMLNAYPDSIGENLHDLVSMLKMPEFKDAFSFFYVLPTFFNSDLDRGFSIIDYNLNSDLVTKEDLKALEDLNIGLKFDIVLNHLSVASPQFKSILNHGKQSKYIDFFIDWNAFWEGNGEMGKDGVIIPEEKYLSKLFMRKSGLPVLKVLFPDGTENPYWNTFYQDISYAKLTKPDLQNLGDLSEKQIDLIIRKVNSAIDKKQDVNSIDFGDYNDIKDRILQIVHQNRSYLGQMDVNAKSQLVWDFYEETLSKLKDYGCQILRLDAFAYLHKEVGQSNFFNKPGTWQYLDRIKQIAVKNDLMLLPEIHAEYGIGLHEEVASKGYHIYDFFLPGLMIYSIENGTSKAILTWAREIIAKGYKTVNMLGCHDGIPVLDLKGKEVNGAFNKGLLNDADIEDLMNTIIERGGRVKNLYDPSGQKISYYQVNATFFSALGEDERKLLLARAIQMFMPGIPQVWYLDIFAGKNDYQAADKGGNSAHKEINRSALDMQEIKNRVHDDIVLNQLELIRLRNTSKAFSGTVSFNETSDNEINIEWVHQNDFAELRADLKTYEININYTQNGLRKSMNF
jgi:sucrose phosphorylase